MSKFIPAYNTSYIAWYSTSTGELMPIHYIDVKKDAFDLDPTIWEKLLPSKVFRLVVKWFKIYPAGRYVKLPDWLNNTENSGYLIAYASPDITVKEENGDRIFNAKEFMNMVFLNLKEPKNDPWFSPASSRRGILADISHTSNAFLH